MMIIKIIIISTGNNIVIIIINILWINIEYYNKLDVLK